jgi:hypothetical protein
VVALATPRLARCPSMFTRLRREIGKQRHALWMSAIAVAFVGLCRAACIVLVDASGNFVDELLNSWVGRIGEWLVLGGVMTAYAVHLRRQHGCAHGAVTDVSAAAATPQRRPRMTISLHRKNLERLPAATRRPCRFTRKPSATRRARFA